MPLGFVSEEDLDEGKEIQLRKRRVISNQGISRLLFQAWVDRNTLDVSVHDNYARVYNHKSYNQPQSSCRRFYIETWAFLFTCAAVSLFCSSHFTS